MQNKIDPSKLVLLPTAELKPNPKNRNKHPDEQIERLAEIIRYQGFRQPIIVSSRSGYIVAGHGRLLAAQRLEIERVPVVFQDFESEEQEYAFQVSDNAVAAWAELDLAGINADLPDLGPDFDIDLLGIKDFTLDVAEKLEPQCDEDEVPEAVEPKTKPGDIYQLGRHRLMCGDSTDIDAVEELMDGEKADMVFTDPPYNTGMTASNRDSARLSHMFDDKFTDDEWQALLSGFTATMWAAMKDSSVAYVCLDWRRSHELVPHLKAAFKFSNLIIWDKMVHGLGSDYKYTHEFIHVCKKGSPEIDSHQGEREYSDVWHIQRKMGRDDEHATKKPIELIERCINHASRSGGSVLDLFCGSGSTLIAAEKTGRKAFLMELSPRYVDTTVARWEKYTGKKAELLNGSR